MIGEQVWEVVKGDWYDCTQGELYKSALAADQAIATQVAGLTGEFVRHTFDDSSYQIEFYERTPVRHLLRQVHVWAVTPIEVQG